MTNKTMNRNGSGYSGRHGNSALRLAIRLVDSQLSNGIELREAVQFAAKYHDVTCAAIEAELSRNAVKGRAPYALG